MIIKEESIDLTTPFGAMRTYIYRPVSPGKYPGLMLFSEIFQQTGPIKRTAAFMAGHGYIVAVPEIFHELETLGAVLSYDQVGADRGNKNKISKRLESYDADIETLSAFFASHSDCTGKLGAIGICIGGHLAFLLLCH
jgi:carboxymethylenebutenolidase